MNRLEIALVIVVITTAIMIEVIMIMPNETVNIINYITEAIRTGDFHP